jgi:aspartate 1-decarboxylase
MISYGVMDETEAKSYIPRVVHVDGANRIVELGGDPAALSPGVRGQLRGDLLRGDMVRGDVLAGR